MKETNSSEGLEAENNAIRNIISLQQVSWAENNVYTYKL